MGSLFIAVKHVVHRGVQRMGWGIDGAVGSGHHIGVYNRGERTIKNVSIVKQLGYSSIEIKELALCIHPNKGVGPKYSQIYANHWL